MKAPSVKWGNFNSIKSGPGILLLDLSMEVRDDTRHYGIRY